MIELQPYPNRKILRKMGYLRDQKGIINRYLREEDHWEEHLRNSREYILNTLERNETEMVGILGSGWLIDVPLEELSEKCKKLFLVDLCHPPQVVHRVKRLPNVQLVLADITGGWIVHIWNLVKRRKKQSDNCTLFPDPLPKFNPYENPDVWISLNLLDQLDDLVTGFMRKSGLFSAGEMEQVARAIQDAHVDFLKRNRGVLIADTLEFMLKNGIVAEKRNPLKTSLPEGSYRKSWKWIFDTEGDYRPGMETWFEVTALRF